MIHDLLSHYTHARPSSRDHKQSSTISLPLAAPLPDTSQDAGEPQLQKHVNIQKEQDVQRIDEWITRSPWLEDNAHEPLVGSQCSSLLVDKYGVRGLSCYSALVEWRDDGSFGCCQERCVHFSVGSMERAVTHQRTHHYDHRPYTCTDVSGLQW